MAIKPQTAAILNVVAKNGIIVTLSSFASLRFIAFGMPEGKAPHFPQQPVARQNDDGSLELECFLDASPQPDIKWFYDNKEVKPDSRFQFKLDSKGNDSYSAILQIKSPSSMSSSFISDAGEDPEPYPAEFLVGPSVQRIHHFILLMGSQDV
ncbi:hypothetical protein RB195_023980 [Necator americanus]|uniref:Immunoglobulin I-set domain-containing protein n=1 Tax=Necator americanus TaxID=51031 RepID=A0ABR1ELI4_NECAM